MDKTLGLKLELVTAFGSAAQEAVSQLRNVRTGLEELSKVKTDLTGLSELAKQITSLNSRAKAAADRVQAMGGVISQAGSQSRAAAGDLNQTAQAAEKVEKQTSAAAKAAINLGSSLTGLNTIRVDSVGYAMTDIQERTMAAKNAADKLTESLLRLAAAKKQLMLGGGFSPMALPGQASYPALNYGGSTPMLNPAVAQAAITAAVLRALPRVASYGPVTPGTMLTAEQRRALGPGQDIYDNQLITTRLNSGPTIAQGQNGPVMMGPSQQKMLTGSTDPNWVRGGMYPMVIDAGGGAGGGGGKPPIDWKAFYGDMGDFGGGMKRWGQELQSNGMAAAINAGLLGGAFLTAANSAMDIDDLLQRTKEALKSTKANAKTTQQFLDASRQIPQEVGSDYKETVGAGYNFISALPTEVQNQLNDPKMMQTVIDGYRKTAQLIVAGSSSQHHISMEEGALDMNNVIANLGFDTSTPAKLAEAQRKAGNLLINMKNTTSNEVDTIAQAIKAIGPIAKQMHLNPETIAGLLQMEAEGKVRGQPAGYAIKRLIARQAAPSTKTQHMLDLVNSFGANISMFNEDGSVRDLGDQIGDVSAFLDKHKLPDKTRAEVITQMAGLYAMSNLGLMMDQTDKAKKRGESAHSMGHKLLNQDLIGHKGGDHGNAVESAAAQRDDMEREKAKTSAAISDASFQFIKAAEPDILAAMKALTGLVKAFDSLSPGMKRAIVDFAGITIGATALVGVGGILFGNTIKLAGSFIKFAGNVGEVNAAMKAGAPLAEAMGGTFGKFGGLVGKAVGAVSGGLSTLATVAVNAGRAVLVGMGPIGWILLGITAAVTLLAVAWSRDWGGIREKTSAAVRWITQEIPKIPQQLGYAVGRSLAFIENLGQQWTLFWLTFPMRAEAGTEHVVTALVQGIPKWSAAGLKAITSWGGAILQAIPKIAANIGQAISNVIHILNPMTWVQAGAGFAANFTKGLAQGIKDGKPQVKAAQQQVRDLFPGSEPKDSSSPLYGMGKSGQAFSDMFIRGAIDGLFGGHAKLKKAAKAHIHKPVMDEIITLKDESVKAIEAMVTSMEKTIEAGGGRISKKWIDLVQGGHSTRFYGNTALTHTAIKQIDSDPTARNARDYLMTVQNIMAQYPTVMKKLSEFLAQATTAHTHALITKMIATVQAEHTRAIQKFMAPFEKGYTDPMTGQKHMGMTAMQSLIGKENNEGDKFDQDSGSWQQRLQRDIDLRKNKEIPSLKELLKYQTDLTNAKKQLSEEYKKENDQLFILQVSYDRLKSRIDAIKGTDAQSIALKKQLTTQLHGLGLQISDVTDRLGLQKQTLDGLDDSFNKTTEDIRKSKAGLIDWESEIKSAFGTATKSAVDAFSTSLENIINSKMMKMFGKWSQSGSPIMQAIGTFVQSFVGSLTSSIIDKIMQQTELKLTNWFTQIASRWFGGGGSNPMAGTGMLLQNGQLIPAGGGGAASSIGLGGIAAVLGGSMAVGGGIGSLLGANTGAQSNHAMNGAIGAGLGATGVLASAFLAPALFGGTMGMAGIAALLSNPAGWALLAGAVVGGAVLGGSIGPHWGPASNYPDRSDPTYAGFLQSYNSGPGDTGFQIEDWLKNTNPASLSGDQLALYNYFKGLGGANGDLGIANEHDGIFTLGSGQQVGVADMRSKVDQWQQAVQKNTAAQLANAQNADRLAASFTSLILGGPAGFSMPAFLGSLTSAGIAANAALSGAISGNKPPRTGAPVQPQPITIRVLEGATISSDLQTEIKNAIPSIASQLRAAINRANYQQSRLYGDYVSQTS